MAGDTKSTIVDRPQNKDEPRPSKPLPATRYEGGDEIGRGGMGRVVEATDTLLDRRVAVKEALTTDPELLRRFARETKITARLEHPSIVPVYDAGIVDGQPYYVMRRVTGRPLSELIREAASLDKRLALVPNLLAAAQAIAHAHQRGIIHRDIKPSNILVGDLGETVMIDWGLAKVIGETDEEGQPSLDAGSSLRTRIGVVFGTPGFMAPDQLRGDPVGPQGDVYSLGASLYNLLAGKPPHYDEDSTKMMKLAAQSPPPPIASIVPGVPAELSTIVDTALDYDATRRYRDAGAFAEELERFLAGQLVASHRYSTMARLLRFVRKHRAAVAIATAATLLLVVVGAILLSQVIEERDRADEQARLATLGKQEAEAARAIVDQRAEELLLSRARALLDSNPTAAVASLKHLSPKSKLVDEARAIANAARMRGVAWALPGSNKMTVMAELDQTGTRFVQTTVDGKVHVFDLAARKLQFVVVARRGVRARWILDGKQLLVVDGDRTQAFDAVTGTEQATTLPSLAHVDSDHRGHVLAGIDEHGRAVRIEAATGAITPLVVPDPDEVRVSPAGRWTAVRSSREVVVFDPSGAPLLRYPHGNGALRVELGDNAIALIDDLRVVHATLEPKARWVPLRSPLPPNERPLVLAYLRNVLYIIGSHRHVYVVVGNEPRDLGQIDKLTPFVSRFASDYLVVGSDGRRIQFIESSRSGLHTMYLPIALQTVRIITREDVRRVVAIGDDAVVVIELEMLPRRLEVNALTKSIFANERILLSTRGSGFDFAWSDTQTGRLTALPNQHPLEILEMERDDGRVAFRVLGAAHRVLIFDPGDAGAFAKIDQPFDHVELLRGQGIAIAIGNSVHGGTDSLRELFKTDGDVRMLARLGPLAVIAVTDRELVRTRVDTQTVERLPVDGAPFTYASSRADDPILVRGNHIYRWRATLEHVATFDTAIEWAFGVKHGLAVGLADGSTSFVAGDGKITRLASTRGLVQTSAMRFVVPGDTWYEVVELPSLVRWSLPIDRMHNAVDLHLDMSPSGTQMIENRAPSGGSWLWTFPPTTTELSEVLAATNFIEDRTGIVLWPWQGPASN